LELEDHIDDARYNHLISIGNPISLFSGERNRIKRRPER